MEKMPMPEVPKPEEHKSTAEEIKKIHAKRRGFLSGASRRRAIKKSEGGQWLTKRNKAGRELRIKAEQEMKKELAERKIRKEDEELASLKISEAEANAEDQATGEAKSKLLSPEEEEALIHYSWPGKKPKTSKVEDLTPEEERAYTTYGWEKSGGTDTSQEAVDGPSFGFSENVVRRLQKEAERARGEYEKWKKYYEAEYRRGNFKSRPEEMVQNLKKLADKKRTLYEKAKGSARVDK